MNEFEKEFKNARLKVMLKLDEGEKLSEQEKNIIITCYENGWSDGWIAYESTHKVDIVTIIQDAITHFGNVCSHCQRELELDIADSEIEEWLKEKK